MPSSSAFPLTGHSINSNVIIWVHRRPLCKRVLQLPARDSFAYTAVPSHSSLRYSFYHRHEVIPVFIIHGLGLSVGVEEEIFLQAESRTEWIAIHKLRQSAFDPDFQSSPFRLGGTKPPAGPPEVEIGAVGLRSWLAYHYGHALLEGTVATYNTRLLEGRICRRSPDETRHDTEVSVPEERLLPLTVGTVFGSGLEPAYQRQCG